MKQWLIVAELPEPLRTELAQLRNEIDIWSGQWLPPHVTIFRPFGFDLSPTAIREIQRPVAMTGQLLRWAVFRNPGSYVLYLAPTPEPLQRLRQGLLERVPEPGKTDHSTDPYAQFAAKPIYHVTIAASVPDSEINRIYSKVSPVRAVPLEVENSNSISNKGRF